MAQESVRKLIARSKVAQSVADEWRQILDEVYEFCMPNRNIITRSQAGQKKGEKVYNSTAVTSTMNFANRIQSDMMPPFQQWIDIVAGKGLPEQIEEQAKEILEEVSDKLYAVISTSNFDSAVNEMLIDLATGTGAMLIQGGDDRMPVRYSSIPIAQLALEEGPNDTITGVYRTYKVKVRNIIPTWSDAVLPESLKKMLAQESRDPEVELIECSYQDVEEDVYRYEIIYSKDKARLVERKSKESPIVVPRWMKISGETFGRGPLIQALPDIKTLNALTKMILQNASLAIAGTYMVTDDGVTNPNTLKIGSGNFIPVSRTAGPNGPSIAPLPRSGDFSVGELVKDDLVNAIKKTLYDENLPPQTGSVRSATEIIERVKELARAIGSPFGRLMSEFIVPMARRTLEVMVEKEIIEGGIEIDGRAVKINVTSPLAHDQNLSDVDSVVRWLEIMLATIGEDAMMLGAKVEDMPDYLGNKLGVSQTLIRTKDERKELANTESQRKEQERDTALAVEEAKVTPPQGA